MNVNKLSKFGPIKKVFCPHFEIVKEWCSKVKPGGISHKKILIHCGTNDLDKRENDPLKNYYRN